MCGIAGFIAPESWDFEARANLIFALGVAIDQRGGHACGYAATLGKSTWANHRLGTWKDADDDLIDSAAKAPLVMMHARFATCGKKTIDEAHPFVIKRPGKPTIFGAHNGVIWDGAEESAKKHDRPYTVDSREVYELLADGRRDEVAALQGYGVLTWIESNKPGSVFVLRLTSGADFEAGWTRDGGLIWGSKTSLMTEALSLVDKRLGMQWQFNKTGVTWELNAKGAFETDRPELTLASRTFKSSPSNYRTLYHGTGESDGYGEWWDKHRAGGVTNYTPKNDAEQRKVTTTFGEVTKADKREGYQGATYSRLKDGRRVYFKGQSPNNADDRAAFQLIELSPEARRWAAANGFTWVWVNQAERDWLEEHGKVAYRSALVAASKPSASDEWRASAQQAEREYQTKLDKQTKKEAAFFFTTEEQRDGWIETIQQVTEGLSYEQAFALADYSIQSDELIWNDDGELTDAAKRILASLSPADDVKGAKAESPVTRPIATVANDSDTRIRVDIADTLVPGRLG